MTAKDGEEVREYLLSELRCVAWQLRQQTRELDEIGSELQSKEISPSMALLKLRASRWNSRWDARLLWRDT